MEFEFQGAVPTILSNATARTSTFTSPVVDIRDYEGDVMLLQNIGAVSGTSPTCSTSLEDSDDGSTGWGVVPGVTLNTVTAPNNTQKAVVAASSCKRYVRATATIGGTTPSFLLMMMLLGVPKSR